MKVLCPHHRNSLEFLPSNNSGLIDFISKSLRLQNMKISIRLCHFTLTDYFLLKRHSRVRIHGNFIIITLGDKFHCTIFMPGKKSYTHVNITGIRHWFELENSVICLMSFLHEQGLQRVKLNKHGPKGQCFVHSFDNISMGGELHELEKSSEKLNLSNFVQYLQRKPFVEIRFYEPLYFPALMISLKPEMLTSFYRRKTCGIRRKGLINIFPSKSPKKVGFQGFPTVQAIGQSYLITQFLFLDYVNMQKRLCQSRESTYVDNVASF